MNTGDRDNSEIHHKYANTVKNVHKSLKRKVKNGESYEKIWNDHLSDHETLSEYSTAMYHLATDIWDKKPIENNRIAWIKSYINDYFFGGVLEKIREKDKRRKLFHGLDEQTRNEIQLPLKGEGLLLDVGSCYNPFQSFPCFCTIAIDLQPANETVFKCDFTNLKIVPHTSLPSITARVSTPLTSLPPSSFHVVIFCLFLDYLPTPQQRFLACLKAHHLLKLDGILIVVCADSKKQHKNHRMAVEWRLCLESMGFRRSCYHKLQHLHCMSFRKTSSMACVTPPSLPGPATTLDSTSVSPSIHSSIASSLPLPTTLSTQPTTMNTIISSATNGVFFSSLENSSPSSTTNHRLNSFTHPNLLSTTTADLTHPSSSMKSTTIINPSISIPTHSTNLTYPSTTNTTHQSTNNHIHQSTTNTIHPSTTNTTHPSTTNQTPCSNSSVSISYDFNDLHFLSSLPIVKLMNVSQDS